MKKFIATFSVVCLLLTGLFGQQGFVKGYFITNEGSKIVCAIKDVNWGNNPEQFDYILQAGEEAKSLTIGQVKEFGLDGRYRFIRDTIEVDQSSTNVINISEQRNPVYKTEVAFVRVIAEGKANLYLYSKNARRLFFYSINDGAIQPLVYKRYRSVNSSSVIKNNNRYRQQLSNALKCPDLGARQFERVDYNQSDLENIFNAYNNCSAFPSEETVVREAVMDRSDEVGDAPQFSVGQPSDASAELKPFSISLRPRLVHSRAIFVDQSSSSRINLGQGISLRPGVSFSYSFKGGTSPLSVSAEAIYRSVELDVVTTSGNDAVYRYFDLPLGLTYQFVQPGNNTGGFYLTAAVIASLLLDSEAELQVGEQNNAPNQVNGGLALGVGYTTNKRLNFELRRSAWSNPVQTSSAVKSRLVDYSLVVGYRVY